MNKAISKLDKFKRSLPALAVQISNAAARKHPLPWTREINQSLRREMSDQVDQILTREFGRKPMQEIREAADDALITRCNDLFDAWRLAEFGQDDTRH